MSASGTPPDPAAGSGGDPSMEDILASIRRILSEEESHGNAAPAPMDDVLQLDQTMMLPADTAASAASMSAAAPPPGLPEPVMPEDIMPMAIEAAPAAAPVHAEPVHAEPPIVEHPAETSGTGPDPYGSLVAPAAAAAAAQSVGSLMKTLAAERALQVHAGGPTIEDIVRQEIRVLLKHWLDSNLPPMVERLVRAEIERVVGRAVP